VDASSAGTEELIAAWPKVVEELQPNQSAWAKMGHPVALHGSSAIIAVPSDFARNQLEGRLRAEIDDALTSLLGRPISIAVTVDSSLDTDPGPAPEPKREFVDLSTS